MRHEFSLDPEILDRLDHDETQGRLEDVIEAVEALPESQRLIITGIFWEQLSHPANIRQLGITPATYYRRYAAARAKLATVLGNHALGALSSVD